MHPATIMRSLAVLAAMALAGCSSTPEEEPLSSMVLQRAQVDIYADGVDSAEIAAAVFDPAGSPGKGWVLFTVSVGNLGPNHTREFSSEVVNGKAKVQFFCDGKVDQKCLGMQKVRASWGEAMAFTTIWIKPSEGETAAPDAGGQ